MIPDKVKEVVERLRAEADREKVELKSRVAVLEEMVSALMGGLNMMRSLTQAYVDTAKIDTDKSVFEATVSAPDGSVSKKQITLTEVLKRADILLMMRDTENEEEAAEVRP
jgi:hypothetical protein